MWAASSKEVVSSTVLLLRIAWKYLPILFNDAALRDVAEGSTE